MKLKWDYSGLSGSKIQSHVSLWWGNRGRLHTHTHTHRGEGDEEIKQRAIWRCWSSSLKQWWPQAKECQQPPVKVKEARDGFFLRTFGGSITLLIPRLGPRDKDVRLLTSRTTRRSYISYRKLIHHVTVWKLSEKAMGMGVLNTRHTHTHTHTQTDTRMCRDKTSSTGWDPVFLSSSNILCCRYLGSCGMTCDLSVPLTQHFHTDPSHMITPVTRPFTGLSRTSSLTKTRIVSGLWKGAHSLKSYWTWNICQE
jgi:hypothetical protein